MVDALTPKAPTIAVDRGTNGEQVDAAMTRIVSMRGAPKTSRPSAIMLAGIGKRLRSARN